MSTAATTAPTPAPGHADRLRQVWAAARLDLLRLSRGRYRHARTLLMGLPLLVAVVVATLIAIVAQQAFTEVLTMPGGNRAPMRSLSDAVTVLWPLSFRFCVFLGAIETFGGLFRGELSERTLHHVFLQPLRRETVTIGKYLAGILVLARLGAVVWLLSLVVWLAPHGLAGLATLFSGSGLKAIFSYLLALILGLAAYGGLFLLAGMLARGPVLFGAALWMWEGMAVFLPTAFQRMTVSYWLNSLMPVPATAEARGFLAMFRQDAAPAPLLLSVVVCLAIGAAGAAAAAWWSRHLELAYGAKD